MTDEPDNDATVAVNDIADALERKDRKAVVAAGERSERAKRAGLRPSPAALERLIRMLHAAQRRRVADALERPVAEPEGE